MELLQQLFDLALGKDAVLHAGHIVFFLVLACCVLVPFLTFFTCTLPIRKYQRLERRGQRAEGQVVAKKTEISGSGRRAKISFVLSYVFEVEGKTYKNTVQAPEFVASRLAEGAPIRIVYLEGKPANNYPSELLEHSLAIKAKKAKTYYGFAVLVAVGYAVLMYLGNLQVLDQYKVPMGSGNIQG